MILIKVNTHTQEIILECDSDIASNAIHALFYNKSVSMSNDGKCVLCFDMKDKDVLSKDLLSKFKSHIKFHQSYIDWKASKNTKAPILIRAGVTYSKIYKGSYDIPHKDIEDVCKYFFTPAVRQKKFKEGKWDGYIHLYKRWLHQFPTGLLSDVCGVLDKANIPYKVEYCYETEPKKQFDWRAKDIFQLSEDQVECIEAAMKAKRCVVKAATGFGKVAL